MLSKLTIASIATHAVSAFADGGCNMASPQMKTDECYCNANPTAAKFAGCIDQGPVYFDSMSDIPNGACIQNTTLSAGGSTSITTCTATSDCLTGLTCESGWCTDADGVREVDRVVTTCVGPKRSSTNVLAGCPYGGTGNAGNILACHKYWIQEEGMEWKRYIQHNKFGQGDTYSWAYDEAVCAKAGNLPQGNPDYPWCQNQTDTSQGAVDDDGNVSDQSCACTVFNKIAPLGMMPFAENGWGKHIMIHVYNIMSHKYVPPTSAPQYTPVTIANQPEEETQFSLKVVNQFAEDILVYLDSPPARRNEHVTAKDVNTKWEGWSGPTKTMRGETFAATNDGDEWASRITIAKNDDPSQQQVPFMRVKGGDQTRLGGFYVPAGWHLRVKLGEQGQASGWFGTNAGCIDSACSAAGTSVWVTSANAYNYPDRDPLLLFEPNVNDYNVESTDPADFEKGNIWFDVSGVDGINANLELIYGKVDRKIFVPLFETQTRGADDDGDIQFLN